MNRKIYATSRFSPGNCAPEFLESILVGRRRLMARMENTVLDSVRTGAGHHWLLVGPRGIGKSHLLSILFNRIDKNREIRDRVVIAYMKEEERGVSSYLDWLVRVLRAFERRNEIADPTDRALALGEKLTRLTETPPDLAQNAAELLLLRFMGDRKLLLSVENLDELFSKTKGMGREGQQRFRDLVQQHPFWIIVASSRTLFEDVQTRQGPFFGFFRVQHLPMLDFEESVELLGNLAETDGRERLQTLFETPAWRGRIRALHEITGGNPRLLVVFYQFLPNDSIEDITKPFLEMIDSLTPYYLERVQSLSALQRKIVELLCERRTPITVKEIAQSCFITHQTASAQLKRLIKPGVVRLTRVGRKSYYELRDPLFRICFEFKENMGGSIQLFINFLEKFHSVEELKKETKHEELDALKNGGEKAAYNTPRDTVAYGVVRETAEGYGVAHGKRLESAEPIRNSAGVLSYENGVLEANQRNHEMVPDAPKRAEAGPVTSRSFNSFGNNYREKGRREEAIRSYRKAIELEPGLCVAHFNISLTWFQSGDPEKGLKEMERAIEAGRGRRWSESIIPCVNDINAHLLGRAPIHQLPDVLERQRRLFEGGAFSESFRDGLIGALTELLEQRYDIPLERLHELSKVVIPGLSENESFRVVCRLFDAGVRYLRTKDILVLLELPLEERSRLKKLIARGESEKP